MAFYKMFVCVVLVLCLWESTCGSQNSRLVRLKSSSHLRPTISIREKIIEWQCYAICSTSKDFYSFESCQTQCKVDKFKSPRAGQCPPFYVTSKRENHILENLHCLDGCNVDFDCPDVQKCCHSICGPICINPVHIKDYELLPPIPKILHLKLPKGHKVEITVQTSANTTTYYHVETRYHIGLKFSPRKLTMWQWQPVEMTAEEILENKKKRIQICFNLKPGRWYQVRIAAINAHGFRGYSEPSKSFTLSKNPRPPMVPTDLQVIEANFDGKLYAIKIEWCPSKSNLPVEKYKIIWSLYVKSKEESIISNEAYVKDIHQFEIRNLQPESSYYIQVLAMSISGSRRLKSDKISILFNSTTSSLKSKPLSCYQSVNNEQYKLKKHSEAHINKGYSKSTSSINTTVPFDVRFRLNQKFGMIVQISGLQSDKEKFYELCSRDTNCEYIKYSAIRAKKNSLEFNALKYNTTYFLKVVQPRGLTEFYQGESMDKVLHRSFAFKTPECEKIQKRFPKMNIQC